MQNISCRVSEEQLKELITERNSIGLCLSWGEFLLFKALPKKYDPSYNKKNV